MFRSESSGLPESACPLAVSEERALAHEAADDERREEDAGDDEAGDEDGRAGGQGLARLWGQFEWFESGLLHEVFEESLGTAFDHKPRYSTLLYVQGDRLTWISVERPPEPIFSARVVRGARAASEDAVGREILGVGRDTKIFQNAAVPYKTY